MIAKAIKGKGFRGALAYDLNKEHGHVIDTNMSGSTPRELAFEFGEIRKLRPSLGKAVLHVSLSAAPGERLSDEQWQAIGRRYLAGMELEQNQYIITLHTDTEHEHIHLLVNRIRYDGEVTTDSHDYRRQEVLMRAIEREFDLHPVLPSREVERHAPTKGEIEEGLRTGVPSTRQQLQMLCDAAARDCGSFRDYAQRLEAAGVEMLPVLQLDGARMSGLSYRLEGVVMKGSDLGKGYSPSGLAKRGVRYEQERDLEAAGRCIDRYQAGHAGAADREPAPGQERERGGAGRDPGTPGAGDGRADRRYAPDAHADRSTEPDAGRGVSAASRRSPGDVGERDRAGPDCSGAPAPGRAADDMAPLPAGVHDGRAGRAAHERILALAGAAGGERELSAGREGAGGAAQARDRTKEAVEKQIAALGVEAFDVWLRNPENGEQQRRLWQQEELMRAMRWLKRMNARGYDIEIAPRGEHGLVMLTDLTQQQIAEISKSGYNPALTVETGEDTHQVWIKLGDGPVAEPERVILARALTLKTGGDAERAGAHPCGRLAGFTNHAEKVREDGLPPYVLARHWSGAVARNGEEAVRKVQRMIREEIAKRSEHQHKQEREVQRERSRGPER